MSESHRREQKTSGTQKSTEDDVAALRIATVRMQREWRGERRASDED